MEITFSKPATSSRYRTVEARGGDVVLELVRNPETRQWAVLRRRTVGERWVRYEYETLASGLPDLRAAKAFVRQYLEREARRAP